MPSFSKSMTVGALLACAAFSTVSCAENESSLFVIGVYALSRTQCVADPSSSAVLLPSGTLDRTLASGYNAALLVGSHLTQRGSRENLRTETSRLSIEGAHITLYSTTGEEIVRPDVAATGLVNPASGTDPGLASVFAQLIRPVDVDALGPAGQAIVRIRIFGTTLGGQEIESGDYDFPIQVCDGCLITYPPESFDPATPMDKAYLCSPAADAMSESTVQICSPGQDDYVPCSVCAGFNDACRDPDLNPSLMPTMP
jgi:hypothetical protein